MIWRLPVLARDAARCFGIVRGQVHQHADAPHPLALLRACGKRPYRGAAEQSDELATGHRMTAFTISAIASRASRALSAALV